MLSWKIVLYNHTFGKHSIDTFWKMARELEYEFFCWNENIYRTSDGRDTGMTIEDVK